MALLDIWGRLMDNTVDAQRMVLEALKASTRIDATLHDHKDLPTLPPRAARDFKANVFKFLGLQQGLQTSALANGFKFFNITIKSHYLAHLGLLAKLVNPVY
eukprot:12860411-Alexandrium_andersonii.AAC.1